MWLEPNIYMYQKGPLKFAFWRPFINFTDRLYRKKACFIFLCARFKPNSYKKASYSLLCTKFIKIVFLDQFSTKTASFRLLWTQIIQKSLLKFALNPKPSNKTIFYESQTEINTKKLKLAIKTSLEQKILYSLIPNENYHYLVLKSRKGNFRVRW